MSIFLRREEAMVTRVSIPTSRHNTLLSPLSSIGFVRYILGLVILNVVASFPTNIPNFLGA